MRTYRHLRGLGALGYYAIDLNGPMVLGAAYVFHFVIHGTVVGGLSSIDPGSIAETVATDSNFSSPTAMTESNGFQVRFTYSGQGSTVAGAAAEMQDVLNSHAFNGIGAFATAAFAAAEGGDPSQNTAASGNVTTTPGSQENATSGPGFWTGFGTGGVLATVGVGLGLFLLLRD
jgi:hypothetical protein